MSIVLMLLLAPLALSADTDAGSRPNIVWIVGDDTGPQLGCYGDAQAVTPHLDRLAGEGVRFTHAFSHSPVCAPARAGLVTGMYPTTLGAHHMRSKLAHAPPMFTSLMRDAGYQVVWPGKQDFNFDPPADAFDATSKWLDEPPNAPFFAYINLAETHEYFIRADDKTFAATTEALTAEQRHDPARMQVPPYFPDTPQVRRDIARYYDLMTALDHRVGQVLEALERHQLADKTIVIFFGDHGWPLPRGKRWLYDSGIHVPLIVRWPGKLGGPSVDERLVSFIDFAPTMLSLAGVAVPPEMQGQVFLGDAAAPPRQHIFAARDRMGEAKDRIRAVRTERFKYIRNFQPQTPYAQPISYVEPMPTMKSWREMHADGQLNDVQQLFFAAQKSEEELYDVQADPHEVRNLAGDGEHRAMMEEFRSALAEWMRKTGDMGEIPEEELIGRGILTAPAADRAEAAP